MVKLRSHEKELLDLGPSYYSAEEYFHCMKMLFRVNKLFGFFRTTIQTLKKFPAEATLLDIGCGGGLFLIHLSKHFPSMQLTGVDISAEAIAIAQQELTLTKNNACANVQFQLQSTPQLAIPENSVDIILTTLVCHHLSDEELVIFLQSALDSTRLAVIINDLHRHWLAEWFYSLLSPLLFKNRLITHDGLISIRRGFKRSEWQDLLRKAGVKNYSIKWHFPFRWKVILWKNKDHQRNLSV